MPKKRYIYAPIISIIVFMILYLGLDFEELLGSKILGIIICLLLTGVTYVGCIFFFKDKDIRNYEPRTIMHYCYLISKIDNYTNLIDDEQIKKNIKDISSKGDRIIMMLQQKPDKVTQVYDGFDYFLPLTIKILDHFIYLEDKEQKTKEEIKFSKDINETLDYIEKEVDKLLDNMNYTKMLNIQDSIEIFKKNKGYVEEKIDKEDKDA